MGAIFRKPWKLFKKKQETVKDLSHLDPYLNYVGGFWHHEYKRNLAYETFVLPEQKLFFIDTPKAGSLKVKLILHKLFYGDKFEDWMTEPYYLHQREFLVDKSREKGKVLKPIPNLLDLSVEELEEIHKTYYKFCFVRNPYTRLMSAYKHRFLDTFQAKKQLGPLLRYCNMTRSLLGQDAIEEVRSFDQLPTWGEFIQSVSMAPIQAMDNHWYPQYYTVMYELFDFDKVGRLESFAEDMEEVLSSIGTSSKELGVDLAKKSNSSKASVDLSYTEAQRKAVAEAYKIDFMTFGYPEDRV